MAGHLRGGTSMIEAAGGAKQFPPAETLEKPFTPPHFDKPNPSLVGKDIYRETADSFQLCYTTMEGKQGRTGQAYSNQVQADSDAQKIIRDDPMVKEIFVVRVVAAYVKEHAPIKKVI
jgi:hypothetical protein